MAKSNLTFGPKENQQEYEHLSDAFFELDHAVRYLEVCYVEDREIDDTFLLLLLKTAGEKIEYYEYKYGFKVPIDDIFNLQDLADFIRAKDKMMAERRPA